MSTELESTSTESTATESSSTPETAAPASVETSTESGDAAAAAPAFTPNYKFKVLDKEHEIPEFLRAAMKDATTEKQLRELHEKAYGLDVVKPKYQETKKAFDEVRGKYEAQTQAVTRLAGHLQKNDLATFFKELNLTEDQILQYALERVEYKQMPLEQRMAVDAQMQERQRLEQLEAKSQTFEQRYYEEATQNRGFQLDSALNKADVKSIADAFDARVGRPGAFRSEVINRGQLAFHTTGTDIPVEQAMSEVLALARGIVGTAGQAGQPSLPHAGASAAPQAPMQPPIIPNVVGRGASPTKRVVSSIADLRKREAEL